MTIKTNDIHSSYISAYLPFNIYVEPQSPDNKIEMFSGMQGHGNRERGGGGALA